MLKAGALYFAVVFGAGFLLGPLRILWVAPRTGERTAELLEAPLMLGVILLAARWIFGRPGAPHTPSARLGAGCLALALLLGAEFGLVLRLRGLTRREYFTTLDPVSGTVFFLLQGVFALAPLLAGRRRDPIRPGSSALPW